MRLRLMLTTSVNTFFFCTTSFVGWSCYIDRYMLDTFFLSKLPLITGLLTSLGLSLYLVVYHFATPMLILQILKQCL